KKIVKGLLFEEDDRFMSLVLPGQPSSRDTDRRKALSQRPLSASSSQKERANNGALTIGKIYMKNWNLQIGSEFLQKSLYNITSLQHGRQEWYPKAQIPLPFKVYQKTERYPLHQTPPLTLGDPRRAFHQGAVGGGLAPAFAPT